MEEHKKQAQAGPIEVHYSVACVSYNLYNQVQCNYHDPHNDNIEYDNDSLQKLTRNYYKGLAEFLNSTHFGNIEKNDIQGEKFYAIDIFNWIAKKIEKKDFLFPYWLPWKEWTYLRPKLILPVNISELAENGITNETKPFIFEATEQDDNKHRYIDNDRVGLQIMQ